ncbi:hypothetical protein [Nocardioides sp. Iso805N]|uniref:hypothetical protein n=1 Tax=Nocardioides sp. Iso805N TaxID=1283287 RepID=UPI000372D759|nr:hypothetical protein [Nocardioides sp. Iso805N]
MRFCARCGIELGRGLDRGRFCAACGHEAPGNARYPLYADGTAAVTRRRPPSVPQDLDATAVARAVPSTPRTTVAVTTAVVPGAASGPRDVTRRRPAAVDPTSQATSHEAARPTRATGQAAVAATLATMLVVVLLGLFLLLR